MKISHWFSLFMMLSGIALAANPTLTIDRIDGNNGVLTIWYTTSDPEAEELVTADWAYTTDGTNWLPIDAEAIGHNEPKPPGETFITWDVTQSSANVTDLSAIPVHFRMHVENLGDTWRTVAPMPTARYGAAVAVVGERIYVFGGDDGAQRLAAVEEYNPATDQWRPMVPMPTARWFPAAATVNDRIYVIGGDDGEKQLTTVEEYDPSANQWRRVAPMPTARYGFGAVAVDGEIYTIGGYSGNTSLATVEVYNPSTNQWRTAASMPTARNDLATVVVDGSIYAIGGWGERRFNVVEVYNLVADQWHSGTPMPTTREGLSAATVNGRVYAIGGNSGNGQLATVEEYNPETDLWHGVADMPTARWFPAAISLNGRIYVVGGRGASSMNLAEEYHPLRQSAFMISQAPSRTIGRFQLNLDRGLNMIALPVQPDDLYTAKRLTEELNATLVMRFDSEGQRFMPYIPGYSDGDGFALAGGEGYIVNLLEPRQVTFIGTVWNNAAPTLPTEPTTWAFAVAGSVVVDAPTTNSLFVTVSHRESGWSLHKTLSGSGGQFTLATADMTRHAVVSVGDRLTLRIQDGMGHTLAEQSVQVTERMLHEARLILPPVTVRTRPTANRLLPNFPNPLNPETWIPFQLAEPGDVILRVFDAQGHEVRQFNLGWQPAGWYDTHATAVHWDGRNQLGEAVASGVYLCQLTVRGAMDTRRMVILTDVSTMLFSFSVHASISPSAG